MARTIAQACDIEIVERTRNIVNDHGIVIPNEIRINGVPVLAPASDPVIVHGIEIGKREPVKVTLTLFARVVTMGYEVQPEAETED